MKFRILTIIAVALPLVCSCNKWLDITPEDTTTEAQLFTTASGYHSAINGLYQTMSSSSLYGKNLTWGFASALSQNYDNSSTDNSKAYSYTEKYEYGSSEVLSYGEDIWQTAYNVIANANNIIQHLDNADENLFADKAKGEIELIRGEALAIRALMHFEVLRLFADAPAVNANAKAIPYVKSYPEYFSERLTVKQVLDNVTADLLNAADLVAITDTLSSNGRTNMLSTANRYFVSNSSRNFFFTGRGTRLNYVGIRALLARVYAYAGDLEKAYKQAQEVEKFSDWYGYVTNFTDTDSEANRPHKLVDELLVSFYDENIATTYTSSVNSTDLKYNNYALKNLDNAFTDASDIRQRKLTTNAGASIKVSLKYIARNGSSAIVNTENRLLPVMRLSEVRLIEAEYLAKKGSMAEAVALIDELLAARKCSVSGMDASTKLDEVLDLIRMESYRESIAEGQYFFFCKRINAETINNDGVFVQMKGKYTMQIPDTQVSLN